MLSQSILATVLSASAVFAATSPAPLAAGGKNSAPANIPQCATLCMNTKLSEAATWYGAGDLAQYCTHPNFLVAYNTCLKDHCTGDDLTTGQQVGATACGTDLSALNATLPAATNGTLATTTNSTSPTATNSTSPTATNSTSPTSTNAALETTGSGNTSAPLTGGNSTTTTTTTTSPTGLNSSLAASNHSSPTTNTSTTRFGNSSNNSAASGASGSPASIIRADFALLGSSLILLFTSFFF